MKKLYLIVPEKLGTIEPEVYGHFSEHIGGVMYDGLWVGKQSQIPNIDGWRTEAVELLKKIHIPVLRWPGGCFTETYHWRDGIGENRPVRRSWWTPDDGRYEPNEVGLHEFCHLCELLGAKPYIAVNVTSMTPMDVRDMMDYCLSPRGTTTLALEREKNGRPEPFDIPFWGVGNENWGGGGNMTADYYALEYRKYATVMRNVCGKSGELVAGGADAATWSWTDGLLRNLSASRAPMNYMSFHYYCGTAGTAVDYTDEDWYTLLTKAARMEELINRHYAIAQGYGVESKARLVIDEWGCWHKGGSGPSHGYNLFEQQSTMRDAMVAALTLNLFNNHCEKIRMANVAQICNNLHCLLLAGGEHCITTPTYHVFDMYQNHMGATAIRTVVENEANMEPGDITRRLSASASVKDGYLTVTLANLSCREEMTVELSALGAEVETLAQGTLLCHEDFHAHNTFEEPETVVPQQVRMDISSPVILPAAGILSLRLKLK